MITVDGLNGKFTCYEDDWVVREIQTYGAYSRPEVVMVASFLRPKDTAIDVGAHVGTFSVPIKKAIGENGRLFAFEANPETFGLLKKNLADNNTPAEIFNKGVSSKKGPLYLKGRNLKERGAKIENATPFNSGADHLVEASSTNIENLYEVELVKIDDVVPGPVHFIKIDVEGFELSVLQSAEKIINAYRPIVYSEYFDFYLKRAGENPAHYEDFFKSRKYHFFINDNSRWASNDEFKLVRIPGPRYIKDQVDFLLIPEESDRYPAEFLDWKTYKVSTFLWNRLRNFLSPLKSKLRSLLYSQNT